MSYTKLTDFASKDALLTGNPSKLIRGTELGAEFDAIAVADALNIKPDTVTAATGKTTPVGADLLTLFDSASTFSLKKLTWANTKATLKTYFDTLYAVAGSYAASGANNDITSLTALTSINLPNDTVQTADIANAQVTPAKLSQPLTSGTAVATTSGTSHDFTGIPSWVKKITVSVSGVSTNGTSLTILQLGDSGGIESTGYTSYGIQQISNSSGLASFATGFSLASGNSASAASTRFGQMTLCLLDTASNLWSMQGQWCDIGGAVIVQAAGTKALSATLDRVRLTTVNGTDTFDAGSINILYE